MRDWAKYHAEAGERSRRASHAAQARWDAAHASQADEPVRETRVVELRILDSHRTGRTIRLAADQTPTGWSRWRVWENGTRICKRNIGTTGIAAAIAWSLR